VRDLMLGVLEASNWVVGGQNGAAGIRLWIEHRSLAYRMLRPKIARPVMLGVSELSRVVHAWPTRPLPSDLWQ